MTDKDRAAVERALALLQKAFECPDCPVHLTATELRTILTDLIADVMKQRDDALDALERVREFSYGHGENIVDEALRRAGRLP